MGILTQSRMLKGSRYHNNFKSIEITDVFMVDVPLSVPDTAIYLDAIETDGVPKRYDYHPTFNALVCTSIECEPMGDSSPRQIKITAKYEYDFDHTKSRPSRTGKCTLEFTTAMANVKATTDADGNDMILYFYDPNRCDLLRTPQPAEFDVQIPTPVVTFRRAEPIDGTDYVDLKLRHEGHVNSRRFLGRDPGYWLCTLLEAALQGDSFAVTYQFQFNINTWVGRGVYREPESVGDQAAGSPALDVSVDNGGIKDFLIYPQVDFGQLGIYY